MAKTTLITDIIWNTFRHYYEKTATVVVAREENINIKTVNQCRCLFRIQCQI